MMNNNMNNNGNVKLAAGDKIKLVKPIGPLGESFVGDVYEITKYENGIYYFECPYGMGCFTPNEFDAHFELCDDDEYEKCDDVVDMWTAMVDAYHKAMNDMNCENDERGCECHDCHCNDIPDADGKLYMDENGDFEFELCGSVPEYIENILEDSEVQCDTVFDSCAVVSCRLPNGYILVEHSAISNPKDYDYATEVKVCMNKIVNKLMGLEAYRDMWDYAMLADEKIDVGVDDIDIEKLHKTVQEIENQRTIDEIDKKINKLYDEEVEKANKKKYDMNLRMKPWWAN